MPARKAATPQIATAAQPLSALGGVGARVAEKLAARGLLTLQDLWFHLPRQYEDRTELVPIRLLQPGRPAQIEGRVEAVDFLDCTFENCHGALLASGSGDGTVRLWDAPPLRERFRPSR